MFERHERKKVFKDPILDNIVIEYKLISDLIDSKEVQRLRRIRQLSGVSMVFHTAEHSRFGHALGTYEISRMMINDVYGLKEALTLYEQIIFMCSSLLHDLGHGPYSHSFEKVFNIKHEKMTCLIINNPDTEVNHILKSYPTLAEDISSIILHTGKFPLIESLVSSQLDVDRLDYLGRDAYFTGATYGFIDLHRLIRMIRIVDNQVVFMAQGTHTIENYLMNRYHMYWQVYYHPKARSSEIILQNIYVRIKDLYDEKAKLDEELEFVIKVLLKEDIMAYIELDDAYINGLIKKLEKHSDPILSDLSTAFLNRQLFSHLNVNWDTQGLYEQIKEQYNANPLLKKYYFKEEKIAQYTYLKDNTEADIKSIKILLKTGEIIPLDEYSPIILGLVQSGKKQEINIFYGEPIKWTK